MAKFSVPYLVRKLRRGRFLYYWQPDKRLRDAGWTPLSLGTDETAAIDAARAQNKKVELWRNGGAAPREVRAHVKRGTFGELIADYLADDRYKALRDSTKREYKSCLGKLETWAGGEDLIHITRARVQTLKKALLKPAAPGGKPSYARARNVMSVLYNVLQIAVDDDRLPANPAAKAGVPTAPPRNRVITVPAIEALCAQAVAMDLHAIEFAIRLGFTIMQREADVLHLTEHNWKELEYDVDVAPENWPKLVGPDGRVFGFAARQRKTRVPIKVPVVGAMRTRVEAAIAAHRKAHPDRLGIPIVLDPESGQAWPDWKFQRRFRAVVNAALEAATKANDRDLVEDLTDIEYRDFRRSGMVHYFEMGISDQGIAAISGHKLDHTKKILETYGPRNTRMAAGAVAQGVTRLETRRAAKEAREKSG